MKDRHDNAVRWLIGAAVLATAVSAVFVPADTVSRAAHARWSGIANGTSAVQPVLGHTFAVDVVTFDRADHLFTGAVVRVPAGSAVVIRGWAVSPRLQRTASSFVFRVDGGPWRDAAYHVPRPDVVAALTLPGAADSGWRIDLPAGALRPGTHTIALATRTENGAIEKLPALAIDVSGSRKTRR